MKTHRKQKLIIAGVMLAASAAIIALLLSALSQNINLFYTPTQIVAGEAPVNKQFRAGGMVVEGSIIRNSDDLKVRFALTDFNKEVEVSFKGILPDLFGEGQGIVVDGMLSDDKNYIIATEVLAKHDENYMPPAVADMLKNKDELNN